MRINWRKNNFKLKAFTLECNTDIELDNDLYINIHNEDKDKTTKLKYIWDLIKIEKIPNSSIATSKIPK